MYKFFYRLRRWSNLTVRGTLFPIFEPTRVFEWIALVPLLYISYSIGDIYEDAIDIGKSAIAIIFAVPAWLLFNMMAAIFLVSKEEKSLGHWTGAKSFMYHDRRPIGVYSIMPEQNGELLEIKVPHCPTNCFASLEVEYDGAARLHDRRFNLIINNNRVCLEGKIKIRLAKGNRLLLEISTKPNFTETLARFYLSGWNADDHT